MQLYNQIKGIFFLSIFMMLMLHNLLPHVHHQHKNSHATTLTEHAEHDHHHGHAHHHPAQEEEEEETGGFLSLLLGNHAHSTFHEHSVPLVKKLEQSEVNTQQSLAVFKPERFIFLTHSSREGKNHFVPYRYRFKSAPPLYNLSLRAPPFLG